MHERNNAGLLHLLKLQNDVTCRQPVPARKMSRLLALKGIRCHAWPKPKPSFILYRSLNDPNAVMHYRSKKLIESPEWQNSWSLLVTGEAILKSHCHAVQNRQRRRVKVAILQELQRLGYDRHGQVVPGSGRGAAVDLLGFVQVHVMECVISYSHVQVVQEAVQAAAYIVDVCSNRKPNRAASKKSWQR